jgi:hypothetical protein
MSPTHSPIDGPASSSLARAAAASCSERGTARREQQRTCLPPRCLPRRDTRAHGNSAARTSVVDQRTEPPPAGAQAGAGLASAAPPATQGAAQGASSGPACCGGVCVATLRAVSARGRVGSAGNDESGLRRGGGLAGRNRLRAWHRWCARPQQAQRVCVRCPRPRAGAVAPVCRRGTVVHPPPVVAPVLTPPCASAVGNMWRGDERRTLIRVVRTLTGRQRRRCAPASAWRGHPPCAILSSAGRVPYAGIRRGAAGVHERCLRPERTASAGCLGGERQRASWCGCGRRGGAARGAGSSAAERHFPPALTVNTTGTRTETRRGRAPPRGAAALSAAIRARCDEAA